MRNFLQFLRFAQYAKTWRHGFSQPDSARAPFFPILFYMKSRASPSSARARPDFFQTKKAGARLLKA